MSASSEQRPQFVLVVDLPDGNSMIWCGDGVWRQLWMIAEDRARPARLSFEDGCILTRGFKAAPSRPRLLHARTVGL